MRVADLELDLDVFAGPFDLLLHRWDLAQAAGLLAETRMPVDEYLVLQN